MSSVELQPIILAAGRGSRMSDLSAKIPKALLPVANLPMMLYPLQMLDNHGFDEVIILVLKSQRSLIENTLRPYVTNTLTRIKRLDYVSVPDDEDLGTADSLRHIKDKIKGDLLVVSCDLLADVPLYQVADVHRAHSATVTALFSESTESGHDASAPPGTKTKKRRERDFIGLEEGTDRLLFLASETDFEEAIDVRKSLLKRHPCIDLYSRLVDTHLYIISRPVLDLLAELRQMTSLKGEVLPYLIKLQYAKRKSDKTTTVDDHLKILENADSESPFDFAQQLSSFGDTDTSSSPSNNHSNKVRCYGYVMKDKFCVRANTLVNYCEANRQMTKNLKTFFPRMEIPFVHPTITVPSKSQVGPDSLIDEGTLVSEKVSIKKSAIGSHSHLAERVRLTNSIIMDHVIIGEGCNIQNSIVCSNAQIGEKSELKDTIVGTGQHVNSMSKLTNEVIVDMDQMMEF